MKHNHIAIDFNNLFWRSVTTTSQDFLAIYNSQVYNFVIQDLLKRINELKDRFGYEDCKVYFLIDNNQSKINIRKLLDEQYKHPREYKNIPSHFYSTLNFALEILKCYSDNFYLLREDNIEADDLTFPLRKYLNLNENNKCLFVSADLDWARNISENSCWFNYSKMYNEMLFKLKYGFSPLSNNIQIYKAIRGDSSDNIPIGVIRLPEKILLHILEKYDDIDSLYKNLESDKEIPNNWYRRFLEEEERVRKNYQLADFILLQEPIENIMHKCNENIKCLRMWFKALKIPFEPRMIEIKKGENTLFQKRRLPRI